MTVFLNGWPSLPERCSSKAPRPGFDGRIPAHQPDPVQKWFHRRVIRALYRTRRARRTQSRGSMHQHSVFRSVLYKIRYDPVVSGGAALPHGWKLLFREANRADSEPRARQMAPRANL